MSHGRRVWNSLCRETKKTGNKLLEGPSELELTREGID